MNTPSHNFQTRGNPNTGRKLRRISSSNKSIVIPASPAMKKLGFGTGVKVFLMERFSPMRGTYASPWAIKKIDSKLKQSPECSSSSTPKRRCIESGDGVLYKRVSVADMCNKRLEAEAKLLRSLKHPNIIGFRSYTTALDGTKCLAMETGERDLFSMLEERADDLLGPLPSSQCLKVCEGVSHALRYLHCSQRLLHGDIKAANVLINGRCEQVKLCDFGVCLRLDDKLEVSDGSCYIGTECWSPPEAVNEDGPITDRADVYAFGLTIWECLCLSVPHVNWLSMEEGEEHLSEIEQERLCDQRDEVFREHLGTRPALLPCAASLSDRYLPLVEAFYHCTSAAHKDRPTTTQLVQLFDAIALQYTEGEKADSDTTLLSDLSTTANFSIIELDTTDASLEKTNVSEIDKDVTDASIDEASVSNITTDVTDASIDEASVSNITTDVTDTSIDETNVSVVDKNITDASSTPSTNKTTTDCFNSENSCDTDEREIIVKTSKTRSENNGETKALTCPLKLHNVAI